jgi:glycosyltransferase involved in cell wall biosynthesis
MPNHNHALYISEALRCILDQSVRPLEVLVIDDGSTDDSIQVVSEIARREPLVQLLRNCRNRGVIATFNRGLALARGDYVYGAAADDRVLTGFFCDALAMASEYPEAGIVFGDIIKADNDGNVLAYLGLSGRKENTYFSPRSYLADCLAVEPPGHSLCGATIYRRDRLLEMGGYRESLGSWADTFVSRAIGLKYGAGYVPKPFMEWRYAPDSLAHGTTTWQALRIARRAARHMRSARFRDCFPEHYVRSWEEGIRLYLLRQHLVELPRRRDAAFGVAAEEVTRAIRFLARIKQRPLVGLPLRCLPSMERHIGAALAQWLVNGVERRIRNEESHLYWRVDPSIRRAGVARRICERIPLPAERFPPLLPAKIVPDGGHGYRVSLDDLGIFAPSDEESVSRLRLFEDDRALSLPHYPHESIRNIGQGRFSHWGNFLYFSASDNSDPRRNGRHYTIEAPRTFLSCVRSFVRNWRARKAA